MLAPLLHVFLASLRFDLAPELQSVTSGDLHMLATIHLRPALLVKVKESGKPCPALEMKFAEEESRKASGAGKGCERRYSSVKAT